MCSKTNSSTVLVSNGTCRALTVCWWDVLPLGHHDYFTRPHTFGRLTAHLRYVHICHGWHTTERLNTSTAFLTSQLTLPVLSSNVNSPQSLLVRRPSTNPWDWDPVSVIWWTVRSCIILAGELRLSLNEEVGLQCKSGRYFSRWVRTIPSMTCTLSNNFVH